MTSIKCLAAIPNKRKKQPYRVNIDGESSLFILTWREVCEIVSQADEIRALIQAVKSRTT